jgi:hypothetical protein
MVSWAAPSLAITVHWQKAEIVPVLWPATTIHADVAVGVGAVAVAGNGGGARLAVPLEADRVVARVDVGEDAPATGAHRLERRVEFVPREAVRELAAERVQRRESAWQECDQGASGKTKPPIPSPAAIGAATIVPLFVMSSSTPALLNSSFPGSVVMRR